ncbi:MAG: Patatin, partial [Bacteroidia bacterium]|nr:Patatin [Bacteroidia bacterium]
VEPLRNKCSITIGVHVNPLGAENVHHLNIALVLDRSFHLAVSDSVRLKQKECTFFIEPPELFRFGMFDMDKAKDIADAGYAYAKSLRKEIEKAVSIVTR